MRTFTSENFELRSINVFVSSRVLIILLPLYRFKLPFSELCDKIQEITMEQLTTHDALDQHHNWYIAGSPVEGCRTLQGTPASPKGNDVSAVSRRNYSQHHEGKYLEKTVSSHNIADNILSLNIDHILAIESR